MLLSGAGVQDALIRTPSVRPNCAGAAIDTSLCAFILPPPTAAFRALDCAPAHAIRKASALVPGRAVALGRHGFRFGNRIISCVEATPSAKDDGSSRHAYRLAMPCRDDESGRLGRLGGGSAVLPQKPGMRSDTAGAPTRGSPGPFRSNTFASLPLWRKHSPAQAQAKKLRVLPVPVLGVTTSPKTLPTPRRECPPACRRCFADRSGPTQP